MKKPYKILLIEPDIKLANTIIDWLSDKAKIIHVMDYSLASIQIDQCDLNLVISDINLPEINDLEITQIVKTVNPATANLIITENIKTDFLLTAMQYHADGVFFKPLDQKKFTARVLDLAEESKLRREKDKKIILAIGAHPDDVEIGCGGTLAKFRDEGGQINILTMSLGAAGGSPGVRKKEAQKAAEMLGAKLFLGNLQDTKITNTLETIQLIEEVVHEVKPTHVFTHTFFDSHQDHRCIYQASITACRQLPNLFSYLSPSSLVDFRPNRYINIDQFMEEKLEIIAAYASQISTHPYLDPEMIKATARYWGRFCYYNLVEPLEVVKEHA